MSLDPNLLNTHFVEIDRAEELKASDLALLAKASNHYLIIHNHNATRVISRRFVAEAFLAEVSSSYVQRRGTVKLIRAEKNETLSLEEILSSWSMRSHPIP